MDNNCREAIKHPLVADTYITVSWMVLVRYLEVKIKMKHYEIIIVIETRHKLILCLILAPIGTQS